MVFLRLIPGFNGEIQKLCFGGFFMKKYGIKFNECFRKKSIIGHVFFLHVLFWFCGIEQYYSNRAVFQIVFTVTVDSFQCCVQKIFIYLFLFFE